MFTLSKFVVKDLNPFTAAAWLADTDDCLLQLFAIGVGLTIGWPLAILFFSLLCVAFAIDLLALPFELLKHMNEKNKATQVTTQRSDDSKLQSFPVVLADKDDGGTDFQEYDEMLEKAARLVVQHQQASIAFLQRKLNLGYCRATRVIDALESAGILGPLEGSKGGAVLLDSEMELNKGLAKLKEKSKARKTAARPQPNNNDSFPHVPEMFNKEYFQHKDPNDTELRTSIELTKEKFNINKKDEGQ